MVIDDEVLVFDCGEGVPHQLIKAGVGLSTVSRIFITHHHSDHNGSYGNLLLTAWSSGLKHAVRAYGPPPLTEITEAFFVMNRYDIESRIKDEGRVPIRPLIQVQEIDRAGYVVQHEGFAIRAEIVDHPPVVPSLAYRIDAGGKSIVVSGDTTRCERLIKLAEGADVLIHEVMHPEYIQTFIEGRIGNVQWRKMYEHLTRSHTSVYEVGKVAQEAGVGTLILSHFVPGEAEIPENAWLDPVRASFAGNIVLGEDMMEFVL